MNSPIIQLLVLAGIAIFLILRLKSVLGTRNGFEPTAQPAPEKTTDRPKFDLIDGGADDDIADHVDKGTPAFAALKSMKQAEPDFSLTEFLRGARGAYEMILMGFENGDMDQIRPFLSQDVADSFEQVINARTEQGLQVDAEFIGIRELTVAHAEFDPSTRMGEVTIRYVAEITSEVRNADGEVVDGGTAPKRLKDVWTFARVMGSDDPNWQLVATGE